MASLPDNIEEVNDEIKLEQSKLQLITKEDGSVTSNVFLIFPEIFAFRIYIRIIFILLSVLTNMKKITLQYQP